MVQILDLWRRVDENRLFDPAEFNRLMNWLNGHVAAPFALVDDTGSLMLSSNPSIPKITFYAPVEFQDTVLITGVFALANTIYLYSRNAANNASVGLIRLNASDIIELGPSSTQRMTFVSPLTNNTVLAARNAANSANVTLIGLSTGDNITVGQAATSMTLFSPFTNNVGLFYRNAANSADIYVTGVNASDQIVTGSGTTVHNLGGTTVVPAVDPPLANGQITSGSLVKGFAHVTVAGGALTLRDNQNIASVTYNAAGNYSIAWDRDFTTALYGVLVTIEDNAVDLVFKVNSKAASGVDIRVFTLAGVLTDPDAFSVMAMGTLV